MEHKTIDRFRGCLYGQAIGDALGLGTEFMTDEDIAGKYPHGLQHYKQIYQDSHRKIKSIKELKGSLNHFNSFTFNNRKKRNEQ